MTTKFEFYFGVERDRDNATILKAEAAEAIEDIRDLANRLFGGHTIIETKGGWVNNIGCSVNEEGRMIMALSSEDQWVAEEKARDMRIAICDALNQAEVTVVVVPNIALLS